jgi:hypothetical protein
MVAYLVSLGAVSAFALSAPGSDAHAVPTLGSVSPAIGTASQSTLCALPVPEEARSANAQPSEAPGAEPSEATSPTESCLASAICAVKQRIRWRTAAWTPSFCDEIAHAVLTSSHKHQLPPLLLVAIMIDESTMNENAVRITMKNGSVYAKDGGLMGLRCVVDKQGRCKNGDLRGMTWSEVVEPTTNIALAAHQLAYWRDSGGVTARKTLVRDADGVSRPRTRLIRCTHEDHGFWAHYNHGGRYIDHGPARNYPVRVASLHQALSRTLKMDPKAFPRLSLAHASPGRYASMGARGAGAQQHSLCRTIMDVGSVCRQSDTAEVHSAN